MGRTLEIYNRGYEDLIPLAGKAPTLPDWTNHRATFEEVAQWDKEKRNVGLLAKHFPGIDCDITDAKLSLKVREIARLTFGVKCPIRIGMPPKWLLVTRLPDGATPIRKRKLTFTKGDVSYSIEVLGDGQQYVVGGIHPDTKQPYRWEGEPIERPKQPPYVQAWPKPLHQWNASDLPEITEDLIDEFFALCIEYFHSLGWETAKEASRSAGVAVDPEQLYAPSVELIESAVRSIPNTLATSREQYVGLAHMIKGACRPEWDVEGESIFMEWASRWPGEIDPEKDRLVWTTLKRDNLRSGWGLLREIAEKHGWTETTKAAQVEAQGDFESVEAATPPPQIGLSQAEVKDERTLINYILPNVVDIFTSGDNDWFLWDGKRWEPDITHNALSHGRLANYIHDVVVELQTRYPSGGAQLATLIRKLHSAKMASTAFTLASRDGRLFVPRHLVNDPEKTAYLLCTPAGVIDLRSGSVLPFDPALRITHITNVVPAKTKCPEWMKFLLSSCGGDMTRLDYVQAVLGSSLTADVQERLIWFLTGPSASGKSTLLKHVHRIVGSYAGVIPDGLLIHGGDKAHSSALADFRDRRFIHGSEIDRGHRWNVSLLKSVTGNEEITARRLYHSFETFRLVGKIIIAGNETPTLTNVDTAVRARLRIIPFTTPSEPDRALDSKLLPEYPAILAWLIEGARKWLEQGYPHCEAVHTLTSEYLMDEDFLSQFRDAHFLVTGNQGHFVFNDDLVLLWNQFMPMAQQREYGLHSLTSLSKALRATDSRIGTAQRRIEGRKGRGLVGLQMREGAAEKLNVEDLL